jgi:hypothetical protein
MGMPRPRPDPELHKKLTEQNPSFGDVTYRDVNRGELEDLAQRAGVPGASEMSKPELAQALVERTQH